MSGPLTSAELMKSVRSESLVEESLGMELVHVWEKRLWSHPVRKNTE